MKKKMNTGKKSVTWSGMQREKRTSANNRSLFQKGLMLNQTHGTATKEELCFDFDWDLTLDTGATFTSVKNKNIVTGLKKTKKPVLMCTHASASETEMKAEILGMDHKC